MVYTIEIEEILQKQIKIKADSQEEALDMARDLYINEDEILTAEDLKETNYKVIKGEK